MKKGFTLIELLVVVLVIGILAAIAIPGYQGAVDKSRYSSLMPVAKNIKDAQERMLMVRADYTDRLEDLDIKAPGTINGNTTKDNEGVVYKIELSDTHKSIRAESEYMHNAYVIYLSQNTEFADDVHCEALTDSARANKLCQSLNGREIGTNGPNTVYLLEGRGTGSFAPPVENPTPVPSPSSSWDGWQILSTKTGSGITDIAGNWITVDAYTVKNADGQELNLIYITGSSLFQVELGDRRYTFDPSGAMEVQIYPNQVYKYDTSGNSFTYDYGSDKWIPGAPPKDSWPTSSSFPTEDDLKRLP